MGADNSRLEAARPFAFVELPNQRDPHEGRNQNSILYMNMGLVPVPNSREEAITAIEDLGVLVARAISLNANDLGELWDSPRTISGWAQFAADLNQSWSIPKFPNFQNSRVIADITLSQWHVVHAKCCRVPLLS